MMRFMDERIVFRSVFNQVARAGDDSLKYVHAEREIRRIQKTGITKFFSQLGQMLVPACRADEQMSLRASIALRMFDRTAAPE